MRAQELMLGNISIGCAIVQENRVMASTKKRRIPSDFYRLGLLYLFPNFPNIKHIAYIYNRSIAYLAGMKMNHGTSVLRLLFKCIDDVFLPAAPVLRQVHDNGPF
jgi:hypothetical protein